MVRRCTFDHVYGLGVSHQLLPPISIKLDQKDTNITTMANSPLSPTSQPPVPDQSDSEMLDADHEDEEPEASDTEMPAQSQSTQQQEPIRPPRETRKDKDLNTFLNQMDKYAPIVLSL